ncbi:hypothetical protein GUJ93_ZPchr0013g36908 [Zizania palustris]|uniref:Uncharacterized protein n=1 Tax=Zizania palustris TaxID=103762 RepID=A0A8J5WVQ8_ZIZPA|nr:hypothetical protein GUJ93_ZPchr0013g36908 [Zizania palustris]
MFHVPMADKKSPSDEQAVKKSISDASSPRSNHNSTADDVSCGGAPLCQGYKVPCQQNVELLCTSRGGPTCIQGPHLDPQVPPRLAEGYRPPGIPALGPRTSPVCRRAPCARPLFFPSSVAGFPAPLPAKCPEPRSIDPGF